MKKNEVELESPKESWLSRFRWFRKKLGGRWFRIVEGGYHGSNWDLEEGKKIIRWVRSMNGMDMAWIIDQEDYDV